MNSTSAFIAFVYATIMLVAGHLMHQQGFDLISIISILMSVTSFLLMILIALLLVDVRNALSGRQSDG